MLINKRPPDLIAPLLRFWHLLGNPPKNINCSPMDLKFDVLLEHHTKHTHTKFCDKVCYILRVIWEKMSVPNMKNLGLEASQTLPTWNGSNFTYLEWLNYLTLMLNGDI